MLTIKEKSRLYVFAKYTAKKMTLTVQSFNRSHDNCIQTFKKMLLVNAHSLLSEKVLDLLRKKNVHTVLDFLRLENRVLERCSGLTYPEILEVRKHLAKTFSAPPINALTRYQKTLTHSAILSTGISELDILLEGGLYTGSVYELCGSADSEKLHFILTILKTSLRINKKVYFLDTKRDFSAKLMRKKLSKDNSPEYCLELMKNILVKQISDKHELISVLFNIKRECTLLCETSIQMIIIHSLSTLILSSTDYCENNHILSHLANILRYIAREYNIVIVITNLVTTWMEGFQNYQEKPEKIACGRFWRGVPNVRLKIEKKSENGDSEISLLKCDNVVSKENKCTVNVDLFE